MTDGNMVTDGARQSDPPIFLIGPAFVPYVPVIPAFTRCTPDGPELDVKRCVSTKDDSPQLARFRAADPFLQQHLVLG